MVLLAYLRDNLLALVSMETLTHAGMWLARVGVLLMLMLLAMQLSQLMTTLLDAQQQPDELVALFLGEVELVAQCQLVDQRLRVQSDSAFHISHELRQHGRRQRSQHCASVHSFHSSINDAIKALANPIAKAP